MAQGNGTVGAITVALAASEDEVRRLAASMGTATTVAQAAQIKTDLDLEAQELVLNAKALESYSDSVQKGNAAAGNR